MGSLGFSVFVAALMFQVATTNESEKRPDTQAVRSILDKYSKACESKDYESFSSVFAHDPDIVMISTFIPDRFVGWKSVAAVFKALSSSEDILKVRHNNIQIKLFASGKAACLTCNQDAIMTYQGKPFTFEDVRMTWVLENKEGQWRVIHAHWSLPASFE